MKLKGYLISALTVYTLFAQFSSAAGVPGVYDYLTFAQRIDNRSSGGDKTLMPHGLWPTNYNVRTSPDNCSATPLNLVDPLEREVRNLYSGQDALVSHEWSKHGTCTTWTSAEYFGRIVNLNRRFGTPAVIRNNAGKSVSYADVTEAYGGGQYVMLACNSGGKGEFYKCPPGKQCLHEIRTMWNHDGDAPFDLGHNRSAFKEECNKKNPIYIPDTNKKDPKGGASGHGKPGKKGRKG